MGWIYLVIAGVFEISFAVLLKLSNGTEKLVPFISGIVLGTIGLYFVSKAMIHLPAGTSYAVWTGIGTFGIAVIGILFFKDPVTFWRIFFLCTLLISIVGLKLVS